ncbi:hypothetical protein C3Y98_04315 [Methylotenera oryzisoli]|uniref:Uncharacterized protein n=1 Tax=Methylotenera oryzisoli TaxID=2080758 RepID=A0A4Y9VSR6_9PROT|nr:hypothetical protein [Methylotenera oryzisoli]TFW72335.1 hypothetical protein C3Y98_04315 [Methylotenera oryzisoli]
MTLEEAHQIKEYLQEIMSERSNQRPEQYFINELNQIFNSKEEIFSVVDQVEQVLSLLRIQAFPVNKKDIANLYEALSGVLGEPVKAITFLDPITGREIGLNDVQDCTEEEVELRKILDLYYPNFENEFDSFRANDNSRKNRPKP